MKERERPASADGVRSSNKFQRPCYEDSPRPASTDSSSRPSRPASPKPSRPGSAGRASKSSRADSVDGSKKFERAWYKDRPRPASADGSSRSPRPANPANGSPKLARPASADGSPKSPRPGSSGGSPRSSSRSLSMSSFKRWGSPFPQFCKKSPRPCSPDYTKVSLQDDSAFASKSPPKRSHPWQRSSPETLQFVGSSNPATQRMIQITACAANARAPFPELKVRKLVFYKNTDKESLIDELQSLKVAVADQTYHFQLHKAHLSSLRAEHSKLEEKVATLESVDGAVAPRTGGESRLISKITGMRMKIQNLEDNITTHQENIQNLKYRYQVCLTREACIQRDMAAGDVWRLQKEYRNANRLLSSLTRHNRKFLDLRDKILPDLEASLQKKQESIKETKLRIKEVEKLVRQCTDESYEKKRSADKHERQAKNLQEEGKRLRAKLKQERERKRKTQEDVWALGYETRMLAKENRRNEKLRTAREADKARREERQNKSNQKKRR